MKTSRKLLLLVLLSSGFVLNSSFHSIQDINTGIFKTYDDYVNHHLTVYDAITLKYNDFKGVFNGKKIPSTQYKDADFWGAENDDGIIFRINKKANVADRIIGHGKIWYYAGQELVISLNYDGSLNGMGVNAVKGTKFSEVFWFSQGGEGEMIGASVENLAKLFADSPDLVAKVNAKYFDETNVDKWVEQFKNVNDWIREYEKSH